MVIGQMEKNLARELWNTLMEIFTQVNGVMEKRMARVTIFSIKLEWNSLVFLNKAKLTKENGYIRMVHFLKVHSKIIYPNYKVNGTFLMAILFKEYILK